MNFYVLGGHRVRIVKKTELETHKIMIERKVITPPLISPAAPHTQP